MNIAIFTDCYLPVRNGVVTSILNFKIELEKKGYHVIVITSETPGYKQNNNVYDFSSITVLRSIGIRYSIIRLNRIIDILKKNDIDIIHLQTEFSIGNIGKRAAKKMKLPVIFSAHTLYYHYKHYVMLGKLIPDYIINSLYRRFLKDIDYIVCPSIKMEEYIKTLDKELNTVEIENFISKELIESINNAPVDLADYGINFRREDKLVAFIGRVSEEKRIWELTTTLKHYLNRNSNVKMIVVGGGPDLKKYKKYIEREDLNVYTTGYVDLQTIFSILKKTDVLLTLSLSEVNPMTVLEASVCGVPVIARREQSIKSLIIDKYNGVLLDSDNEVIDVLVDLMRNEEKLNQIKENSKKEGLKLLQNNSCTKFISLYQAALKDIPTWADNY